MSASALRPLRPSRFRRGHVRLSVEELRERLAVLVNERQGLRDGGATDSTLERNRLQIARTQWELAHALIERHLPPHAAQSAA